MVKKRILFDILIVAILIVVSGLLFLKDNFQPKGNTIAIIHLKGIIGGSGTDSFTYDDVKKILNEVSSIKPRGVILRISSPGGSAYESDKIYQLIEDFKSKEKLKVYVSMGEECASGGYYIAMAGDKIFAEKNTITGSIGVIMNLVNYEELLKKIGISITTIKSGTYKDIGSPYRALTDEERKMLQDIVSELYENFLSVVNKNRKLGYERIKSLAQGQIYTGNQAKNLGLVDQIGTLDDTIENLKVDLGLKEVSTVEFKIKRTFLESLFSSLNKFFEIYNNPYERLLEYRSEF